MDQLHILIILLLLINLCINIWLLFKGKKSEENWNNEVTTKPRNYTSNLIEKPLNEFSFKIMNGRDIIKVLVNGKILRFDLVGGLLGFEGEKQFNIQKVGPRDSSEFMLKIEKDFIKIRQNGKLVFSQKLPQNFGNNFSEIKFSSDNTPIKWLY